MNLITSSDVISILNISDNNCFKETLKVNFKNKYISINHFDGETFGVLDENDLLSIFDLSGQFKSSYQLKPNITCFKFYNDHLIIAGDSHDNLHQYDLLKKSLNPSINTNLIKNDGIKSINISRGRNLLYFLHKNGSLSKYNVKEEIINCLKYNTKVKVFDVNQWFDKMLLLGCFSGTVATYDTCTECTINEWSHHKQDVTGVAFSRSNKHVGLSISRDRTATFIGCDTNSIITSLKLDNEPLSCTFGDNFLFAIGDDQGIVSIYDFRTIKLIEEYQTSGKVSYMGFNYTDHFNNQSSQSSRLFKNKDNTSVSNHSLFSLDSSLEFKENFDFSLSTSVSSSSINVDKQRRQVKFQIDDYAKVKSSTPIPVNTLSDVIQPTLLSHENAISHDINSLKKFIADELKQGLTNFEYRIKNDLLFGIVDQLTITENNIVVPITTLLEDNKSLMDENEILRRELRKYKYNA